MPRNLLQTVTIVALLAAIVFVAHNFVTYVLRVDGGYSQWTVFTECTKSCGEGTRFRTRTCSSPVPRFGGRNCSILGEDTHLLKCNILPCPVDGGYGAWSDYSACSVTCGEGVQQRDRRCDNPMPQFRGLSCDKLELGPSIETKSCKMENCPINGGYGPWGEFGICTVSCGGGTRQRVRECNDPSPNYGGKTCEEQGLGESVQTQSCNEMVPCPIDGGYTDWTEFTECTVTCGGGTQQRSRECTNPEPANAGKNCEGLGPASETRECNTQACPPKPAENQRAKQNEGNEEKKAKESEDKGNEKDNREEKEEKKEESPKEDKTNRQESGENNDEKNEKTEERKEKENK